MKNNASQLLSQLREELRAKFGSRENSKINEFLEISVGLKAAPVMRGQRLDLPLFFPGLMNQPWHSAKGLHWVRQLECHHEEIKEEALDLMKRTVLDPYGGGSERGPLVGWKAHLLYQDGQLIKQKRRSAPATCKILESVPIAEQAMFSILEPGCRIPEHADPMNFMLTCHLGLIIPKQAAIRVGSETRVWKQGKCFLMDATYLHEAWNEGSENRVILLLDVWHPELSPVEIQMIKHLLPKLIAR